MSGSILNRFSFMSGLAALACILVLSTHALAQYKSSGHVKRSHGSGGYSHGSSGGAVGYVKQNRSFNAQYKSSGFVQHNHGLRLKTHSYTDALRSGVRLGNSGYDNRGYTNRNIKSAYRNRNDNNTRHIQHVKNRRGVKNEGYSYGTNPRNKHNIRRTNQFNSDSDLYYVDQYGYSVLSSNNNIADSYYDDDFRQIVVIQGEGGSPACPKGHDCGYRLYEDGTGPRIISLGADLEGLPPQDGINGGPKIITLD